MTRDTPSDTIESMDKATRINVSIGAATGARIARFRKSAPEGLSLNISALCESAINRELGRLERLLGSKE